MSQEGEQIININNEIVNICRKKPKYRPMNKIAKPGGMLEKLRALQHKRLMDGCSFAASNCEEANQRKIEIIQHCKFRRRLMVEFKFIDGFESRILEDSEIRHFMDVPLDFEALVCKHSFYDVVLDQLEREFIPSHFMHFCKMIKASKKY